MIVKNHKKNAVGAFQNTDCRIQKGIGVIQFAFGTVQSSVGAFQSGVGGKFQAVGLRVMKTKPIRTGEARPF